MAISTTGRVVKTKSKTDLKRVGGRRMDPSALEYNHLRICFADGSNRHFLFTDKQIEKSIELGKKKLKEDIKITWVREVWYEGVMNVGKNEIKQAIEKHNLPKQAKTYNHIRIDVDGEEQHLFFTHTTIRNAIDRAKKKGGKLPKVSWLSDKFFNQGNQHAKKPENASKSECESCESQKTEEERAEELIS